MLNERWTLSELVARVEAELARNYRPSESGQVRAMPDERAVRYYTTFGILDRPLAMRGRTALYGARHFAQLIAIKRLQAQGRSLAEIQAFLPGLDDETLSRVAGVALPGVPRSRRRDFWRAPEGVRSELAAGADTAPAHVGKHFAVALAITLAPGVTLSISPERSLTDADAEALSRAAAPLLAELSRRRLIEPKKPRKKFTSNRRTGVPA